MDFLLSWRPTELPNSWAATHGWRSAWIAALGAIVLLAAFAVLESPRVAARLSASTTRLARRGLLGLLGVAAVLGAATYVDFGVFRYGSYLNEWDVYHYYLGTKYAPELGYTNLYGATLVADQETGLRYRPSHGGIRDLETAKLRAVGSVLAEADRYRARFSPDRWRELVADVAWLKMQLPAHRWSLILADHGYNGTPAWSMVVGGLLTRHLSIRNPVSRWLLILLDPLLLVASVVAVGWAFGPRAALLTVVFVGTHYLFSWGHLKGAILRTDFAVASLVAVCLVKRGCYRVAGALLGWAVLSRVFPGFLLLGPLLLLVHGFWRRRQWDVRLVGLVAACALVIAAGVLGSCVYFGDAAIWSEWRAKIGLHYAEGSDWDMGFRTIAEATFVEGVPVRPASLALVAGKAVGSSFHAAELVAMLLLTASALAFLPGLEHHEALAYGFVFVFLFGVATYYYYLVLVVPFVFFAANLGKPSGMAGVGGMLLSGLGGYVLFGGWGPLASWVPFRGFHQTFPTTFFMSCLVALSVAQMIGLAAVRAYRLERGRAERRAPRCPRPDEGPDAL